MKLETYLNAYDKAKEDYVYFSEYVPSIAIRRDRQVLAFRDRILRMDAEKDKLLKEIDGELELWQRGILQ